MQRDRIDALAWDKQAGLLPAIVQDAATLRVLMLGYMDRAALLSTLDTGRVTFFSRSRQRSWTKGETSGHVLQLVAIEPDCDSDTLLVQATPAGPTCHLARASCFAHAPSDALAAVAQDDDALRGEAADLLYHLEVLLRARGLSIAAAKDVLAARQSRE
jgi:phosphoribosyl-ATP pyrophosphohydrolase/phosphoribosyl-AMP cyclohydrolase